MTDAPATAIEVRLGDYLDHARRSSASTRRGTVTPIEYGNAVRLTRSRIQKGHPLDGDAAAIARAILVVRESQSGLADPAITRQLAQIRTGILDDLVELQASL